MRIVLDANVLISALAFPGSKPDQILGCIRRRACELFISPFILSELDRVLQEKFCFTDKEAKDRVDAIRAIAHVIIPTERIAVVTANDDITASWSVPLRRKPNSWSLVIKNMLPIRSYHGTKIVTPAQCLDLLKYGG